MNLEKLEYIKNWLFRANEDIAVIDNLINAGVENYTSTICFHAQQASEKFLKAFLVHYDVDFPRTHDLDFLLLECQKINKEAFQDINLISLSEFGVSVRYPDDFYIPTVSEAVEYHQVAKELKEIIEGLITPQP